jgi:galactose mutarotase-like enzyme
VITFIFDPMKNDFLAVTVSPKGAELISVRDLHTGFEYIWQADPTIWGRHAPVLFPIVGKVKHNQLLVQGTPYPMSQHGFARDQAFTPVLETDTTCRYTLEPTAQTLAVFPFLFNLELGYELEENTLHCSYTIVNTGTSTLYFSIGAHPGFNLPVADLSQYEIRFPEAETSERQLLTEGLFDGRQKPVLTSPHHIALSKTLFDDDAIVFEDLHSRSLSLKHNNSPFEVKVDFEGFPYMGIWTQKSCEQYICLEPWCGHADTTGGHDDISAKPGIEQLEPGARFERGYSLTFTS